MFPIRKSEADVASEVDRFRGTTQRWVIETGPTAGTTLDNTFHDDWSVTWREVAGTRQGRIGRARQFHWAAIAPEIHLVSFSIAADLVLTVTLNFSTHRLVGFQIRSGSTVPFRGLFRAL